MSKELRHDRHTVSLLTDHMVYSPKYRGKVLVGDVAMLAKAIIRKTCKELDIKIIDMSVSIDHIYLLFNIHPRGRPSHGLPQGRRREKPASSWTLGRSYCIVSEGSKVAFILQATFYRMHKILIPVIRLRFASLIPCIRLLCGIKQVG